MGGYLVERMGGCLVYRVDGCLGALLRGYGCLVERVVFIWLRGWVFG